MDKNAETRPVRTIMGNKTNCIPFFFLFAAVWNAALAQCGHPLDGCRSAKPTQVILAGSVCPGTIFNTSCIPFQEKETVKPRELPLASMYSWDNRQKDLKLIASVEKRYQGFLQELYRHSTAIGASNIFLVRGDDIGGALEATWEVFKRSHAVDEPVHRDLRPKSANIWLVAFCGVDGSGSAWQVSSVQLNDKRVRFVYKTEKDVIRAANQAPYLFWVPLGKLPPGAYSLEMFDEQEAAVSLLRRVVIPK